MMKRIFALIAGIILVGFFMFTQLASNLYSLTTARGYFIPDESNILTFKMLEENRGSGEWWLYGEDGKYYYAMAHDEPYGYFIMSKSSLPNDFSPLDKDTWGKTAKRVHHENE